MASIEPSAQAASVYTSIPVDSIRASAKTPAGELLILADSDAAAQRLGAPSCYGLETDFQIQGALNAVLRDAQGKETIIKQLGLIEIIQPSVDPLTLQHLTIGRTDVYAFVPRYTDCHGRETYFFGVRDGNAFPLPLTLSDGISRDALEILPVDKPKVENGQLVFMGGFGAGMDAYIRYSFKLNESKMRFELTKKESVALNEYKP